MKILIVDDERDFLEQTEIFLGQLESDLEIDSVLSAEEALEELKKQDYDAIVSDYQMPGMDGLDLLKVLREERDIDIPFIIFTGKGREEVAMEALNLGADRYLQKGGDPRAQYSVLANAMCAPLSNNVVSPINSPGPAIFSICFLPLRVLFTSFTRPSLIM